MLVNPHDPQRVALDIDLLKDYAISRDHLMRALGYVDSRLDRDETFFCQNVGIGTMCGNVIGHVDVFIRAARAKRHRVFLKCPICELWIPLAHFRRHVGSATCDATFGQSAEWLWLHQHELNDELTEYIMSATGY